MRVVYGSVFRRFLAELMGKSNAIRAEGKYPQLRTILANKGGMGIHDDNSASYNGVAFFNLNANWRPELGGELVIWEQMDATHFKKRFEFGPRANSVSVMHFSPVSYHSVNIPTGEWVRSNVLVELDFIP